MTYDAHDGDDRAPVGLPPAWRLCRVLHGDNTRVRPEELPGMRPIVIRTDTPAPPDMSGRERRAWVGAVARDCVRTVICAALFGVAIFGGGIALSWGADALTRLLTGAQ